MEKMPGVQLSQVWKSMKIGDRMQLRLNLAIHQEAWLSISFREFGALFYAQDLPAGASEKYLYTNKDGDKVHNTRFRVGPMTGRDWSDCGRADLKCDRGPCKKDLGINSVSSNTLRAHLLRVPQSCRPPGVVSDLVNNATSSTNSNGLWPWLV
jgi:hypothetical protein